MNLASANRREAGRLVEIPEEHIDYRVIDPKGREIGRGKELFAGDFTEIGVIVSLFTVGLTWRTP